MMTTIQKTEAKRKKTFKVVITGDKKAIDALARDIWTLWCAAKNTETHQLTRVRYVGEIAS